MLAVAFGLESRSQTATPMDLAEEPDEAIDAAATLPPYCTTVEHMGVLGYLVDQAWVNYRRIERSSPQRVGWCKCAKRCEPIDRLAAQYERVAFKANELRVDPSIPPDQRREYGELATEMFGKRNESVGRFRSCIDKARPPLQPPRSASPQDLQGQCRIDQPLTVKEEWDIWCGKFMAKFNPLAAAFIKEFKVQRKITAEVSFNTRVNKAGAAQTYGGKFEPNAATAPWMAARADYYQNEVLKFAAALGPIPAKSTLRFYDGRTTFTTKETISKPINCPET